MCHAIAVRIENFETYLLTLLTFEILTRPLFTTNCTGNHVIIYNLIKSLLWLKCFSIIYLLTSPRPTIPIQ